MHNSWGDSEDLRRVQEAHNHALNTSDPTRPRYSHHSMGWVNPPKSAFARSIPGDKIFFMNSHGGIKEDGTPYNIARITTERGSFISIDGGPWEPDHGDPVSLRDWLTDLWFKIRHRTTRSLWGNPGKL